MPLARGATAIWAGSSGKRGDARHGDAVERLARTGARRSPATRSRPTRLRLCAGRSVARRRPVRARLLGIARSDVTNAEATSRHRSRSVSTIQTTRLGSGPGGWRCGFSRPTNHRVTTCALSVNDSHQRVNCAKLAGFEPAQSTHAKARCMRLLPCRIPLTRQTRQQPHLPLSLGGSGRVWQPMLAQ